MGLFVEMGFDFLDGGSDGAVAALFVQTLETSENTLSENGLLFLNGLDVLVLLFLLQEPLSPHQPGRWHFWNASH